MVSVLVNDNNPSLNKHIQRYGNITHYASHTTVLQTLILLL